MRMWMVKPELLCNKHLLGEHGEIHKHLHNFQKKHKIDGRIYPIVQIEPSSMARRHNELTIEMEKRFGKTYNSPYEQPDISYLPLHQQQAKVNLNKSVEDLCNRCVDCETKIKQNISCQH